MRYTVQFKPAAYRQWNKLPPAIKPRLQRAIDALAENPFPSGSAKLQGETALYRIRVGDYCVIYTVEGSDLLVLVVRGGHRREVYR